ncbi:urea transporter, partial [Coemansia spiralis]
VSSPAANALIYMTLICFLGLGLVAGWRSHRNAGLFLKAIRSQAVWALSLNFLAVNIGSGIFFSLPEVGTIAGITGVFAYAFASSAPLFAFAIVGPLFRRHNSKQWSMTAYIMERYGRPLHILYGVICTLFVGMYMVSELTTIYGVFQLLTPLHPLMPMIIICVVTTIYTAFGGVFASLMTDAIQCILIFVLIIVAVIVVAVNVRPSKEDIERAGLVKPTKMGGELFAILFLAILFSNMYHQGFWQRTFASRNDRDLRWATFFGFWLVFVITALVGMAGPLAAWAGTWSPDSGVPGSSAFFTIIASMDGWVSGLTLVLTTSLSCCAIDTCQTAMFASLFDLVEEKANIWVVRAVVVILNVPIILLAMRAPDILQVYLLADLLASATIIPVLLGLFKRLNFIHWMDALVGCFGGIIAVGAFGQAYLGNRHDGWRLLLLDGGLYVDDERVLGAFCFAPLGSVVFMFFFAALRMGIT